MSAPPADYHNKYGGTAGINTATPLNNSGQSHLEGRHVHHQSRAPVQWSSGLCHCTDDVSNCCITCWCPCITFGQISEIVDKGSSSCALNGAVYTLITCVVGCACFYSCFYRTRMRQQYALKDGPCGDCCVHFCCESCALCQEYRELKSRGYDMSIGWHGNLERRNGEVSMTPIVAPRVEAQGMTR